MRTRFGSSRYISRRGVLQSATALAAVAGTRTVRAATPQADVLVIGAGLAGLRAAHDLQDAGVTVQVIEGRKRAGGRVLSLTDIPGNPEAGGNGIGAGYGRMIDSAQRFNVKLENIADRAPVIFQRELVLGNEIIKEADWEKHPRNPFKGPMKKMMPWVPLPLLMTTKNPLGKNYEDWYDPKSAHLDISMADWFRSQGLDDAAI
ncbi:MAG: FAD-dependent oxidoreductase, partial [Rhodospirillaceae bacterium]|nr:FAD-dependent oxidoreductase [Rhodospirillaceae bacterium]